MSATPSTRFARWPKSMSASSSTRSRIRISPSPSGGGWRGCSRSASRNGPPTASCSGSRTCASRCATNAGSRSWPLSRRTRRSASTGARLRAGPQGGGRQQRRVGETPAARHDRRGRSPIVPRRSGPGPREPEPGARLHVARAGAPDQAAAPRVSGPAHRRSELTGHRPGYWRARFRTTFAIDCGDSSKTRARRARFRVPTNRRWPTCCARTNLFRSTSTN